MPVTQTPLLVTFNLFLLVIIYMLMRRVLYYPYRVGKSNRQLAMFFALVFVLFSFWGSDWFHYLEDFPSLQNGDSRHMEDVYVFIAQKLSVGYISFRLVVWGTSLLMLYILIRRLSVNTDLALFFFLCIWLIWFSYARVSLAMVLVYLGASLLYKPFTPRVISYLSGGALLVVSIFFHKTAVFAIIIVLISLLGGVLNKRLFAILLLVFMCLASLFLSSFLMDFLTLDYSDGEVLSNSIKYGQLYLTDTDGVSGIGAKLQRLLELLPYYSLAVICYMTLLKHEVDSDIAINMRALIFIVLISFLLSFDYGLNTSVISIRFIRFAFIPSSVILAYIWKNKLYVKMTRMVYSIALLGTVYAITYSLYCSIVGG